VHENQLKPWPKKNPLISKSNKTFHDRRKTPQTFLGLSWILHLLRAKTIATFLDRLFIVTIFRIWRSTKGTHTHTHTQTYSPSFCLTHTTHSTLFPTLSLKHTHARIPLSIYICSELCCLNVIYNYKLLCLFNH